MFVCTFQRMLQNVREQNCGFSGINACNLNANIYRQYRFIDDLFDFNMNSEINSRKSTHNIFYCQKPVAQQQNFHIAQ